MSRTDGNDAVNAEERRTGDPAYYPGWEAPRPLEAPPDPPIKQLGSIPARTWPTLAEQKGYGGEISSHDTSEAEQYPYQSGHNGELPFQGEQLSRFHLAGVPCEVPGPMGRPGREQATPFPLEEVLTGDINRLRHTYRFNTAMVLHRENVAEHSYYVMVYAMLLARWVTRNTSIPISLEGVLLRAMVHDWDEARTGDVVRSFKHSDSDLLLSLEAAATKQTRLLLDKLLPEDSECRESLSRRWATAKDLSPEGRVVALADYLSVLAHLWQEVNAGNATLCLHNDSMIEYLETFSRLEFNFLRPILTDVDRLVRRVLATDRRNRLPEVDLVDVPREV